jgi:hypothetical protein
MSPERQQWEGRLVEQIMRKKRLDLLCASLALGVLTTQSALGDEFFCRMHQSFERNRWWPQPFTEMDRSAVRNAFCINAEHGYKKQNTLVDQLFDAESQQLNTAGEAYVRMIVTRSQVSRRDIYVVRGPSEEATVARMDSVQQAVAKLAPRGAMPSVTISDRIPALSQGSITDVIRRQYDSSTPAPRIPAMQESSGGSSE